MENRVKFNDNVEIHIFEKDEPAININKNRGKLEKLYDKWSKYLFGYLIILFIVYLFVLF